MLDPRLLDSVESLVFLSSPQRERLARHLVEVTCSPGDVLVREGQRAPGLFLLLSGGLEVTKRLFGQDHREMSTPIPPGEWFGMISVIDGLPATGTVRAITAVRVASLARDDFHKLINSGDPMGAHFLRAMLRCTALQLARINDALSELRHDIEDNPS